MRCLLLWLLPFVGLGQVPFHEPDHKARLGEVHYGNRVGGLVAQEGQTVAVLVQDSSETLQSIQVCVDKRPGAGIVRGFRFGVRGADGRVRYVSFGSQEGAWEPPFNVPNGRNLIGISGACGWFVDNLRFHFDDQTTTPRYGGNGGDTTFQLLLTQKPDGRFKGRFMGFWGSWTHSLETIGLIFYPYE
jgi:hypothetical protein